MTATVPTDTPTPDGSRLSRRAFLRTSAAGAAGALLVAQPRGALANPLGPRDAYGTARGSRLFPGTWVAHADLHNHSLMSDGAGDPALAFASMRDAGLDVAALTDHSTIGRVVPGPFANDTAHAPCFGNDDCKDIAGIDELDWQRKAALANEADRDGQFTALRGFEWSSPTLGHMNVWFSQHWSDPLETGGLGSVDDLLAFAEDEGLVVQAEAQRALGELLRETPAAGLGMRAWYEWLKRDPSTPLIGGGADALVGFNHPGREPFRFSDFLFDADLLQRLVSMEIFNRREDYLFRTVRGSSPLVGCLDAGWKPGLLGVTDQHGTNWGLAQGLGRGGYYVTDLTRQGVREAMLDRRFYATNLEGLRVDAAANGVRMGRTLGHRSGPVTFEVDIDRGPAWTGTRLQVQVLTTGRPLPRVLANETVRVPGPGGPRPRFTVAVDAGDAPWLVLRICDPHTPPDGRADDLYASFGGAIAYASPWYLDPDLPAGVGQSVASGSQPAAAGTARVDTPLGRFLQSLRRLGTAGVPDRGTATSGPGGAAGLLAIASAGLLALRERHDRDRHAPARHGPDPGPRDADRGGDGHDQRLER